MNISILYGGASSEHKISIQTGLAIAEAIKDRHKLDMILGKAAYTILKRTISEYGSAADLSSVANFYENETGARIQPGKEV